MLPFNRHEVFQASKESPIISNISLDLKCVYWTNLQEEIDSAQHEVNCINRQAFEDEKDSSLQFEFPGDIRLQIVVLEDELRMRRGKRRGYLWKPKDQREKSLSEDSDDIEPDKEGFFISHNEYLE